MQRPLSCGLPLCLPGTPSSFPLPTSLGLPVLAETLAEFWSEPLGPCGPLSSFPYPV